MLPPPKIFTILPETLCINCQEVFEKGHLLLISAQTIQTFFGKTDENQEYMKIVL